MRTRHSDRERWAHQALILNGQVRPYAGELARYKRDKENFKTRRNAVQFLWRESEYDDWSASPLFTTNGQVTQDWIIAQWKKYVNGRVRLQQGSDLPATEPAQIRIKRKG